MSQIQSANYSTSNKRIAKNSLFLFIRTLFIMAISLYTSRIVLNVLGVEDYGIYNVVAGIVAMLTFLNSAMIQASQRYMNFAQGSGDLNLQINVFSTSILIHITIAVVVLIVLESIGLWYVNNKVVLPPERLFAANVVYQFALLIFLSKVLVVPFSASVISHEQMHVYAYVSMIDAFLQLIAVFFLKIIQYDKLIIYGFFLFLIAVINYLIYYIYSKRHFEECVFKKQYDKGLFKEMFSFASWAFLGGAGFIARSQGVNIVINLFCGPAVNAARGVAYQVSSAVHTFVSSFTQAINPQITKRYAGGDVESMMSLVRIGSKYTFLILLMCCLPIMLKSEYILGIWLGNVPKYAPEFLIMALSMNLITSMDVPLNTAMQATGDIKLFQIVVSIIMCCDIPLAYFFLNLGIEPYLVTGVSIFTALLCFISKLFLLKRFIDYSISYFVKEVVIPNLIIIILCVPVIYMIGNYLPDSFLGFLVLLLSSFSLLFLLVFCIAMNKMEKDLFVKFVTQKVLRRLKK